MPYSVTTYLEYECSVIDIFNIEFMTLDRAIINLFFMIFGDFNVIPSMADVSQGITLLFQLVFALAVLIFLYNYSSLCYLPIG